MASVSTVPTVVDIVTYAGDTFDLEVRAAAEVTDGKQWSAEIRADRASAPVDATFVITEPTEPGGSAYLRLTAADSARLARGAPVVQKRMPDGSTRAVQQYSGVYDCEVSLAGSDPVRTLVQGTIKIELDVTRVL